MSHVVFRPRRRCFLSAVPCGAAVFSKEPTPPRERLSSPTSTTPQQPPTIAAGELSPRHCGMMVTLFRRWSKRRGPAEPKHSSTASQFHSRNSISRNTRRLSSAPTTRTTMLPTAKPSSNISTRAAGRCLLPMRISDPIGAMPPIRIRCSSLPTASSSTRTMPPPSPRRRAAAALLSIRRTRCLTV